MSPLAQARDHLSLGAGVRARVGHDRTRPDLMQPVALAVQPPPAALVVAQDRTVQGELVVQSANTELDTHLTDRSKFQIVANLKRDEAEGAKRTLSFDDCFIEGKSFSLSSGGSVSTTYTFTATRAREE